MGTPQSYAAAATITWKKIAPLIENGLKTDCGIEML
jgi:hypothetical protein